MGIFRQTKGVAGQHGSRKKKEEKKGCCCGADTKNEINTDCCCSKETGSLNSVKVLGAGCKSCHEQLENAKAAVESMGLSVEVELVKSRNSNS